MTIHPNNCPRCGHALQSAQGVCPVCGWTANAEKRNQRPQEQLRCPTCSARVQVEERACPICGAQILRLPDTRNRLPHLLLSGVIVALLLVTALWFMEPSASLSEIQEAETATSTATRTLWLTPTPRNTYTLTPTASETPTVTPTPLCIPHVVEENENLQTLAERFKISEEVIRQNNKLAPESQVQKGQALCMPVSPETVASLTPQPTATAAPVTYSVEKGDNVGTIAEKFDISVNELLQQNNITQESILQIGQKLVISKVQPTSVPDTATPIPTATQTALPTVTPTASSTPVVFVYPPLALLAPLSGSIFQGQDAPIVLSWAAADLLATEDWYLLQLYEVQEGKRSLIASVWTKSTSWRVRNTLYPEKATTPHAFQWEVVVAREKDKDKDEWVAIGLPSQTRYFFWY